MLSPRPSLLRGMAIGLLVLVFSAGGCADDGVDGGEPDADVGGKDSPTSSAGGASETAGPTITVGVFVDDGSGGYQDTGRTLVFRVGVRCDLWHRTTDKADAHGEGPHEHHNAATDTSYVDGVLTWTEFGPEATRSEAEAVCLAGEDGVTKSVDETGYTPDKAVLLRIVSVD